MAAFAQNSSDAWRMHTGLVKSLVVESSISTVGDYAFNGFTKLTDISLPGTCVGIGGYAFRNCSGLTEVSLPSGLETIGNYTFSGCSGLTAVAFPDNLTGIGAYAFQNCGALTEISLPDLLSNLGDYAFSSCTRLTDIIFPEGITAVGNYAFSGCKALTGISFPSGLTDIGNGAFQSCTGLTEVMFPTGLTNIGSSAFSGCTGITDLIVPNSVTELGSGVFRNCTGLLEIALSESITSVCSYAFYNCSSLTEIVIPEGVTAIDYDAMYGCASLNRVTIPESVTQIGSYAFNGCTGLTDVFYEGTQTNWRLVSIAGNNDPLTNAAIHYGYYDKGQWGDNITWKLYEDGRLVFSGEGEFADNLNLEEWLYDSDRITSVVIEEGITSIGDNAFLRCDALTEVSLPESLNRIGAEAFSYSGLRSVVLPASLMSIESFAFSGCPNLAEVFLPASLTTVGNSAFYECGSLNDVHFAGTRAQWNGISIGNNNDPLTNAAINFERYDILYDANGGTDAPAAQTKVHGENLALRTDVPICEVKEEAIRVSLDANGGTVNPRLLSAAKTSTYTFAGWNSAPDGSGETYLPGSVLATDTDLTLYAQWTVESETTAIWLPTPVLEHYSFYGWALRADAEEGITGYYTPEEPVTLYALWKLETYTISFDGNGGTGVPETQIKTYGVDLTLPDTIPACAKDAFLGWAGHADAVVADYKPGDTFTMDADTTLYAVWLAPDCVLPGALKTLEEEALMGAAFVYIQLPETTISIQDRAFADCPNLRYIYIPFATTSISRDAFLDAEGLTIMGDPESYAAYYAQIHHYTFVPVG